MKKFEFVLLMLCIITLSKGNGQIQIVPFANNLSQPVDLVTRDNGGLFVVERTGKVQVLDASGSQQAFPFLDITDRVNSTGGEQGLLGLAIHPEFIDSSYIYVNYTGVNGTTFISRFEVNAQDSADRATEKILLSYSQPYTNHNGGDLLFGPNGYLYISSGDGGNGGDPQDNAQNLNSFLVKILRIDVDNGNPYAIPPSNPYLGVPNTKEEIWAYGVRNPWRFSFDEIGQQIICGDVGQNAFEEISVFDLPNPSFPPNYGWRCLEASTPFNMSGCDTVGVIYPIYEYAHLPGSGCTGSVTGGIRYKGTDLNNYYGKYFFSDFCTGYIATYDFSTSQVDTVYSPSSLRITAFGEDSNDEIYFTDVFTGTIYRIENHIPVNTIYSIDLNGSQAGTSSTAEGYGFAVFDSLTQKISVSGKFSDLSGNVTSAHLHIGQPGATGATIFPLQITTYGIDSIGFFGEGVISNTEAIALLQNDGLYVNINSSVFNSGEIRGQIIRKYCPIGFNATAPELPSGVYKFHSGKINGSLINSRSARVSYHNSVTLDIGTTIEMGAVFETLRRLCP